MRLLTSKRLPILIAFVAMLTVLSFSAPTLSAQAKSSRKTTQKKKPTRKKSSTKKKTSEKKKSERTGRLPNHFGKLKLKDEQREKIYKIQARYTDKITKLRKELESLRAKADSESKKILTKAQRRDLAKLTSAAEKAKKK